MDKNPENIMLAKLAVVVMPNGEIICLGNTVGWVDKLGKYLSDVKTGVQYEVSGCENISTPFNSPRTGFFDTIEDAKASIDWYEEEHKYDE